MCGARWIEYRISMSLQLFEPSQQANTFLLNSHKLFFPFLTRPLDASVLIFPVDAFLS